MRRIVVLTIAVALFAAACSGSGTTSTSSSSTTRATGTTRTTTGGIDVITDRFDPNDVKFVAALERLDSCDAALAHFQDEALKRVGPYGLNGGGGFYPMPVDDVMVMEESFATDGDMAAPATTMAAGAPALAGDDSAGRQEGVDYSGTNVQVAGVDEPDIVKTDGNRILAIVDGVLTYVDVSGDEPSILGKLRFDEGWNHTLFAQTDTAYVFSYGHGYDGIPEPLVAAADIMPDPWFTGEITLIHQVDLSDPGNLEVVRTLRVEGRYLSARAIGDTVRVVVNSYPNDLPFVYPSGPAAEDFATEANQAVIRNSTIGDWLPSYTLFDGDTVVAEGLAVDCDRVHRPAEFAGFDSLSVLTFTFGEALDSGRGTSVIAQGETVYASSESLYVATNVWIPDGLWGVPELAPIEEDYSTAIHMFDISGDGPADYLASGSVDGHLLNQFSMDEYDGVLRVATTDGPPWWFEDSSESFVVTLERDGDQLVERGKVGNLGRGERIFSVRFLGETGYVVTFRQTDPLYVIDLRDASNPTVTGELKILGYSAYLHPMGNGMLLGVGQDADEDGRTLGAKVSLFDVSDPANPQEVDTWTIEDGYTDVEWDHHAFLYWAPLDMAVLPVQSWATDFIGAVVLNTEGGFTEVGRISHEAFSGEDPDCRPVDAPDEYMDEGMIVQVCADDQIGGVEGYWCESISGEELKSYDEEIPFDLEVGDDERLEVCWPEYGPSAPPIQRSLVIGDTLWTLSMRSLQGNGIVTLDLQYQLPVG